jgi:hypothetical protein
VGSSPCSGHPYRSPGTPELPAAPASLWEIDAEIGVAALSSGLVVAGLFGQCGQSVTALAMLGMLASTISIVGWARRARNDIR